MRGVWCLAAAALAVAAITGCGSSKPGADLPTNVQLRLSTKPTGGKALVITAATDKKLTANRGALYALELRGIDVDSGDSFDNPTYVDPNRCVGGSSCQWTVVPDKAGTYEYEAFALDEVHDNTAGQSNPVRTKWAAPPRPDGLQLFINGRVRPSVPLTGDHYYDFPAGPMRVEARWTTDARGTGYYIQISDDSGIKATCSAGTSCRVPGTVPLEADQENSWFLELLTTRGDKIAGGFKTCVRGVKA